jgi:hypothetical protein
MRHGHKTTELNASEFFSSPASGVKRNGAPVLKAYYCLVPGEETLLSNEKHFIQRQSELFFENKKYLNAMNIYRKNLIHSLNTSHERASLAAHTAAMQIQTFYVVPVLHLLYACLDTAAYPHKTLCYCRALICEWRMLVAMLRTFARYPSSTSLVRIDKKLQHLNLQTLRMWYTISKA